MAWIDTVAPEAARGLLRRVYEAAVRRAGKVWNILSIQSLRPETLKISVDLYLEVMHSPRRPSRRPTAPCWTSPSSSPGRRPR
jgi:hypothetical protein